jgi:glycogen operon protein
VNFALFSANAEAVDLCLFAPGAEYEHSRISLSTCTDGVWHGHVQGLEVGTQYGYRIYGPYAPGDGHRFNPYKLCVDPYARQLSSPVRVASASYGFINDDPFGAGAINREDSAPLTPRAIVTAPQKPSVAGSMWAHATAPTGNGAPDSARNPVWRRSWADTVIYEAHVGGMTRLHACVEAPLRGSFAGLAHPRVIEHLQRLGVSAIELMPVHAFVDDAFLVAKGLRNYWGYSTLGFFAAEHRYLAGAGPEAFRAMVDAMHAAGLEVIIDVVYNHTAEGSAYGPTLSFRGIDNASYYRLNPDDQSQYRDFTGCGNTLNMDHPRVRELVLDSLRYWAGTMGVDGFRFDLATALAREEEGFVEEGPLFQAIAADPLLSSRKMIAEPWDLGPDGYRLGGFPPAWVEWNDRFRDTVRRFWRGDSGMLADFAQRIHGSSELFAHPERGPWSSVNFIASHDGFTAMDLVSYSERHNEPNGEDNRDGHSANYSWNHGIEGETDDVGIRAQRERQIRNLLATALLSHGTPMLLAGDEFGRSQNGNNNAYCQDNETNWMDWSAAAQNQELFAFTRELLALRKRHGVLRREAFPHGNAIASRSGFPDISWLHPRGTPMHDSDWHEHAAGCLGMLLCAAAGLEHDDLVLLVFNQMPAEVSFVLPESDTFSMLFAGWQLVLSTDGSLSPGMSMQAAGQVTIPRACVCVFEPQHKAGDERGGEAEHRAQVDGCT